MNQTAMLDFNSFRGAMKSILRDSDLKTETQIEIINIINQKSGGGITDIDPASTDEQRDFATVFKDYLKEVKVLTNINLQDLFQILEGIRLKEKEYCLLFLKGFGVEFTRLVTRFFEVKDNKICFMHPGIGQIVQYDIDQLTQISPAGGSLVIFSFKENL